MRFTFALCSIFILFSLTGVNAQTDSVPAPVDSLPIPALSAPSAPEIEAPKTAPAMPVPKPMTGNSLTGVQLFSCNGLYFYNKSVDTETDYDWYSGTQTTYKVTYKTRMYAVLLNANYFVTDGIAFGGTLGVLSLSSKRESDHEDSYYFDDYNTGTTISLIGPRLSYYHGQKDSKMLPFAAFEYDILSSDFYSDTAIRIGAGVLFQPRPHFGISFGLDYLKLSEEENSTNIMGVLGLTGILY